MGLFSSITKGLKKAANFVGDVVGDTVKQAAATVTEPVNKIVGKNVISLGQAKTGLGKKLVGYTQDAANVGMVPIASTVNSITNKETIQATYNSKLFKNLGGVAESSADKLHGMLKIYANTLSAGYADKAADLIRDDDAKSSVVGINEYNDQQFTSGFLSKYENTTKKISAVAGAIAGQAVKDSQQNKQQSGAVAPVKNSNGNMSLLGNLFSGAQDFLKTPVGQAAGSMLSNVVVGALNANKTKGAGSSQAQQAVLAQTTLPGVGTQPISLISQAALGSSKLTAEDILKTVGLTPQKSEMPVWLWPVVIVGSVIAVIGLIFGLSKRR